MIIEYANKVEKGISEIVGVFSDPILVFPGGWGDTLPEWLRNAITLERLEMNLQGLMLKPAPISIRLV